MPCKHLVKSSKTRAYIKVRAKLEKSAVNIGKYW